jgi:hypothetical protein
MQIGDTKPLRKATTAFCLVGLILLTVNFGAFYLGTFGFTLVPFAGWRSLDLWWRLYSDACHSAGGAVAAGVTCYLVARSSQKEKSNDAA